MHEYQAHLFGGPRDSDIIPLICYMEFVSFPMITQEDLDCILLPNQEPDAPVRFSTADYRMFKRLPGGVLLFQYLGD